MKFIPAQKNFLHYLCQSLVRFIHDDPSQSGETSTELEELIMESLNKRSFKDVFSILLETSIEKSDDRSLIRSSTMFTGLLLH